MAETNPNARLETFCDGVFAIAITLLILEIKVPPLHEIHSVDDLWHALAHLWPSFFAFVLSFTAILVSWVNHHNLFKLIDKPASPHFIYANGFFLLLFVVLPFPTALMAEYMQTPYAQPAIVLYCFVSFFCNIGWVVLTEAAIRPITLSEKARNISLIKAVRTNCRQGFVIYLILAILSIWFPFVALFIISILWFAWVFMGVSTKNNTSEVVEG